MACEAVVAVVASVRCTWDLAASARLARIALPCGWYDRLELVPEHAVDIGERRPRPVELLLQRLEPAVLSTVFSTRLFARRVAARSGLLARRRAVRRTRSAQARHQRSSRRLQCRRRRRLLLARRRRRLRLAKALSLARRSRRNRWPHLGRSSLGGRRTCNAGCCGSGGSAMARAHSTGGASCGGLARRGSRLLGLSLRLSRWRRSVIPWRWTPARQREERRGLVARERVILVPVEEGVLASLVLHERRQVGHLRGAEHAARLEHGVRSNLVELGRRHVDLVLSVLTGWKLRHPGGQEVAPSVEPAHAQPSLHLVAVVDPSQDLLDASHPGLGVWPRPQQHALVSIIPPAVHLSREWRASRKKYWHSGVQRGEVGGGHPGLSQGRTDGNRHREGLSRRLRVSDSECRHPGPC